MKTITPAFIEKKIEKIRLNDLNAYFRWRLCITVRIEKLLL
jgi:hypothetical protein